MFMFKLSLTVSVIVLRGRVHKRMEVLLWKGARTFAETQNPYAAGQLQHYHSSRSGWIRTGKIRGRRPRIMINSSTPRNSEVFLAKKNDTKELCALKRMSKKLLHKLGEVGAIPKVFIIGFENGLTIL